LLHEINLSLFSSILVNYKILEKLTGRAAVEKYLNGRTALLVALGSFFFFEFLFSEPSPSLALGFLFAGGFELLASSLDDFCRTK
jgi:hypothetical protein